MRRIDCRSGFVAALGLWLFGATTAVTVATWQHPRMRAVLGMGWGLIVFWIVIGGTGMYRGRDQVKATVMRLRWDWRITFVGFAVALALAEEAITTTLTNLAPWFGVKIGEAYITASTNYLDVVALHSVVVFVPMFVAWAWLLSRYAYTPFAVFLLFGITGTLAETNFGWRNPLEFGLWIFVYGLMVYLPAYCVPADRPCRVPRWWHYPLAVLAPFLSLVVVPVPLLVGLIFPGHPNIHFPPIKP